MKSTPRRKRSDSTAAAIEAAQAAALGPLQPPAHVTLRPQDWPFWNAVVTARARNTWTETDLAHAANLARCQADVERLQDEVFKEGDVIDGALNPKHKLIETLSRRAVSLARMLHVHAEAVVGRSRDAGNALALERAAAGQDHDDDLIPSLRTVQ
ncbi:TerS protein [Bordetella genomosp. 9]|uniref:TerS protein n=1 Tax=Bordetella genomosp. 9 TaxID=1416803 RepID=A0A1W6YXF7_9BORD|nr:TerS protein [Bordetella genomosp. 9]ARP85770.1 TerS protein [Bordetella genomosp. 9]